jgi:hypothetical protein
MFINQKRNAETLTVLFMELHFLTFYSKFNYINRLMMILLLKVTLKIIFRKYMDLKYINNLDQSISIKKNDQKAKKNELYLY